MNDDRILEFMAQVSDYMRSTDRRFEQLITVMHSGFERASAQLSQLTDEVRATNQRVDTLTDEVRATNQRVDTLTDEVHGTNQRVDVLIKELGEVKVDVHDIKADAQVTNRRLSATFDQTSRLTEENTGQQTRLRQLEAEEPTNAELHRRVLALEEQMRRAS